MAKILKNSRGFSVVEVLVIVVIIGLISAVGWLVYDRQASKESELQTKTKTPTKPVLPPQKKDEATNTQKYTNEQLKISFSYPKKWGAAGVEKTNGETGAAYKLSFANDSKAKVGVISSDFALGRDGGCYEALGVFPGQTLAAIKKSAEAYLEYTDNANGFIWTKTILENKPELFVYEGLGAGTVNGPGDCAGFYIMGYKVAASGSSYAGVAFFYGAEEEVPLAELGKYKANPNSYLSQEDRAAFITAVKSFETL